MSGGLFDLGRFLGRRRVFGSVLGVGTQEIKKARGEGFTEH